MSEGRKEQGISVIFTTAAARLPSFPSLLTDLMSNTMRKIVPLSTTPTSGGERFVDPWGGETLWSCT